MKHLKLKVLVKQSERIPCFYGLAYWDYERNVGVAYPLFLNLVALLWRDFIRWLKWPKGKV